MAENRRNLFPWFILTGGILLLLAGLVSVLYNRQAQPASTPTPASVEEVPRVTVEEAKKAYDEGTAVFVDVRAADSYEASHIKGALSIPGNELPNRMGELSPNTWIIPY
jgi:3-mercaptopyruvate sulfurtransferase SseA